QRCTYLRINPDEGAERRMIEERRAVRCLDGGDVEPASRTAVSRQCLFLIGLLPWQEFLLWSIHLRRAPLESVVNYLTHLSKPPPRSPHTLRTARRPAARDFILEGDFQLVSVHSLAFVLLESCQGP